MTGSDLLRQIRLIIKDDSYDSYEEINQAYEEICEVTNFFWMRKSEQGLLTFKPGQSQYTLDIPDLKSLLNIWCFADPSGEYFWSPLIEVDELIYREKLNSSVDASGDTLYDVPIYYKLEGTNPITLTVTPTPDKEYQTSIHYSYIPMPLGPREEPIIPKMHHRKIATLASGYVLERSPDQYKASLGKDYIFRVTRGFSKVVSDSHPNRTGRLQPPQIRFVK